MLYGMQSTEYRVQNDTRVSFTEAETSREVVVMLGFSVSTGEDSFKVVTKTLVLTSIAIKAIYADCG